LDLDGPSAVNWHAVTLPTTQPNLCLDDAGIKRHLVNQCLVPKPWLLLGAELASA
jgi:hypothetical protein